MKLVTASWKMADVIHSNYLLMPVINRFGVPPGFGEESVSSLCRKHGIHIDFFLAIINAYSNEAYFPEKELQEFDVLMLVDYLEKTHSYYLDQQIPLIESLIRRLGHNNTRSRSTLRLVTKFFQGYKRELVSHLKREETVTFPYIRRVNGCFRAGLITKEEKRRLSQYSMTVYEDEHDDVDEKLFDLKNILIKYVHGEVDETARESIVFELFRLERDIQDHTRIENNILNPLVRAMEKALLLPAKTRRPTPVSDQANATPTESRLIQQLARMVRPHRQQASPAGSDGLTAREIDVLKLVAHGFINKHIAERLSISLHTVISHRKHITEKLQIKTVPGLTVYAILNGILSSE
jgi:regulator of cell morphogenesis and NO signaling